MHVNFSLKYVPKHVRIYRDRRLKVHKPFFVDLIVAEEVIKQSRNYITDTLLEC